MLHLVKAHSLHRKRVEDRARPVPFSCSLGGARRSHEDVTQILSILLDAHPSTLEDHLPQHLSPLQVSDRESEPSVWEARYDALVARYDLVERRLGDLIAQSTAAQSNNNSDSDEEDATVCQTLRVQWDERAALPSPGSASSQRLRLGQPSFFPASLNASVLREISQSKSHQDAQRLIQQSRAMWGRLEAAMGTPRGMHTLYYRMR